MSTQGGQKLPKSWKEAYAENLVKIASELSILEQI